MKPFKTLCGVVLLSVAVGAAQAQSKGDDAPRVARLIAGGAPGSVADMLARPMAEALTRQGGANYIVENRPGPAGFLSVGELLKAPANGQTLLVISATQVAWNQFLFKKPPYDPEADIIPTAMLASIPMMLVVRDGFPARNYDELIALLKKNPGKYNYAFGGTGTPSHISFERFRAATGVAVVPVPYKSGPNALQDLIGGQTDMMLDGVPLLDVHVKSGKLRVMAMATRNRSEAYPGIPTIAEKGNPDFDAGIWVGLGVKKGTAPEVVNRLNADINKALDVPAVREGYARMGAELRKLGVREMAQFVAQERANWGPVIRGANISLD